VIVGLYEIDDHFVCIATRMDCIPPEVRFDNRAHNDAVLHEGEQALAKSHASIAEDYPDDETTPPTPRSNWLRRELTTLLSTERDHITDTWCIVETADGTPHRTRVITVNDPELGALDANTVAAVLTAWCGKEDHNLYRLRTNTHELTYEPNNLCARVTDITTGELTLMIPLQFPDL
jgi:hypothetical protein